MEAGAQTPERRPDPAGETPPELRQSAPVISVWIAACIAASLSEAIVSGTGVLSPQNILLPVETGLAGTAIDRCLEGGNPLVLAAAPLFHRGLMHLFLSCVGLVAAAKPVERAAGSGITFATIILTGAIGSGAGWLAGGEAALGTSGCYFGFLGAMVALTIRGVLARRALWFSSFPLLVLAAIFSYFVEGTAYLSHAAHAASAVAGVALGFAAGRGQTFRLPVRIALLGWLGAGILFTIASAVREGDWEFQWRDLRPSRLLSDSRLVEYRDPEGRFRLTHPASLEPIPKGPDLVFRMSGFWEGEIVRIGVVPRSPFINLDSLVRTRILQLREEIDEAAAWETFEVTGEQEGMAGEVETRRVTGRLRGPEGEIRITFLFALTDDRMYQIEAYHGEGDDTLREWTTKMLDSLEILK